MTHLICHACRAWLHPDEFHRDRSRTERNGRHVWCKLCRRDLRAGFPSAVEERLATTFRWQSWAWFAGWREPEVSRMGLPESEMPRQQTLEVAC